MILANFIIDGINKAFEWLGGLLVSLFDWIGELVTEFVTFLLGLFAKLTAYILEGIRDFFSWLWETQIKDFVNDFRIRAIDMLIDLLEESPPEVNATFATLDNFLEVTDVVAVGMFCFELIIALIFVKMLMKCIPFVNL